MTAVAVHYMVEGDKDGELVVLSGSLGSDLRMWDPQVRALTGAGYRVLRYDHRGHGQSPAPAGPYTLADLSADVSELLDRVGARQAHFVGLSLGGMVGMWLAERAGHRLRSLTLCCTSANLGPANGWAERAATVRAHGAQAVSTGVVERWFTPQWRAASPQQVGYYEAMVAATSAEGYAACCEAIQTMDICSELPSISAPTLVIAGADDPATPPEHGRHIATAIPAARLEIVAPAAHLANIESPRELNQLILAHLSDL